MLGDNITVLLKTMQVKGNILTSYCGIADATLSRIKTGKKIPKPDSILMQKFVQGVLSYARENDRLELLFPLLEEKGFPVDETGLEKSLTEWLYQDTVLPARRKSPHSAGLSLPFSAFAEKLDHLMKLAGISNARFGHLVNIDPSHISRFRNGHRTPKGSPEAVMRMCMVLMDQITKKGHKDTLLKLIHAPASAGTDDDVLLICLRNWLCDFEQDENTALEQFLGNLDSFSPLPASSLPSPDSLITDERLQDDSVCYKGTAGLQEAILRFLATAIGKNAKELFLYSDQKMDWLTGNPDFRLKWISLMTECVKRKIRIKIIHNIDRTPAEMITAINNWLPLYMSGMIEPYYCTLKNGNRFSHTIFLCPDIACIEGCHMYGSQEFGLYQYHTGKEFLDYYSQSFALLFQSCHYLVRMQFLDSTRREPSTPSDPYNNVCITINKASVVITRTDAPYMSFTFTHPLMYDAFQNFVEQKSVDSSNTD